MPRVYIWDPLTEQVEFELVILLPEHLNDIQALIRRAVGAAGVGPVTIPDDLVWSGGDEQTGHRLDIPHTLVALKAGRDQTSSRSTFSRVTIAGRDIANPTSMILSVAMMLQWMGNYHRSEKLAKAASTMEDAVDKVLENPASRTRDIGGTIGCKAFGEQVAQAVAASA